MMKASDPIESLPGAGKVLAEKFSKLGVLTLGDLAGYLPRVYEDYSNIEPVKNIKPGKVSLKARIITTGGKHSFKGTHITEALASDDSGSVLLVWFNQPYRAGSIKPGSEYFISGEYQLSYRRLAIINPTIELASDFPVHSARIVPIYKETKGLKSGHIRRFIHEIMPLIKKIPETLPAKIIKDNDLAGRAWSYQTMHFPQQPKDLSKAKKRLAFEEVFRLILASLLNKQEIIKEKSMAISFSKKLAQDFVKSLPFKLTAAQKRAVWQIYQDLEKTSPMNRLLEGDVGSGKTVVAAMSAAMAIKQGFQVALMAPTELLARQHAETISQLLRPLGMDKHTGLLSGGMKPAQKKTAYERVKSGDIKFIIGTHAIIQEKLDMHSLGLVIIDEQHRFGVEQRKALLAKAGHSPHVLTMTATPIPRSLALTLYGELDISLLDSLPEGRKPTSTTLVSDNNRVKLYEKVDQELAAGRQAFFVCPVITSSDGIKAKSAEELYEDLRFGAFKHRRVGLLHGKQSSVEKEKIMLEFINQQLDILVSTTVIEVGVDIPNATVMVIEGADRFGLAQIHQLRGRVGRGQRSGSCYLVIDGSRPPSKRLRAIAASNDGFKLSELDLEIRGPGAIYGTSQHGELDLRIAKLTDTRLIIDARKAAEQFLASGESLLQYPGLAKHVKHLRKVTNLN